MILEVFTLNKNGKIELTKQELERLLNKSYWEGYTEGYWQGGHKNNNSWTYASPSIHNPIITCTNSTIASTPTNPTKDKNTIICNSNPYAHIDDGK